MSQEGALGYAQHGFSYQAILAHYYSGTSLGRVPTNTVVRVLVGGKVERVPLERYVRGVVAAEVPASWPLPALEAQAVASRTYALTAHAGGTRFDVYSDTRSQMYLGAAAETAPHERRDHGDRRADRHVRRPSRDHLLLRQLGGNDRERPGRVPRLRARALAEGRR